MKKILLLIPLTLFASVVFAQDSTINTQEETTLIFVRHAEKMDDGTSDPSLDENGNKRAVRLAELLLEQYQVSTIYSTDYKRTRETANPISDSLNIPVVVYSLAEPKQLISDLIDLHRGQTVLIMGHSNTTPMLVNTVLDENKYPKIEESDYTNIYVVTSSAIGIGEAEHLTY